MRTIIAATDFSTNSLYAAYYAADMARMIGARLTLIHVNTIPVPVSEITLPNSTEQIKTEAGEQIKNIKEKLLDRTDGRIIIDSIIKSGEVLNKISEYCESVKPYAVVMGAESAGTLERLLFGGKSLLAVSKLRWPLIIVPIYTLFKNIRKIGLACDFREVEETLRIPEIKDLVTEFKAELHVLHITGETRDSFCAETGNESELLHKMLEDLRPKYHFLNDVDIEKGINDFAERNKLDLLIIVPKKHNMINKIFNHSHSKRLVLHAHVPVMSLHK
jgi:nucleotide-binding universal stress UspA family protein